MSRTTRPMRSIRAVMPLTLAAPRDANLERIGRRPLPAQPTPPRFLTPRNLIRVVEETSPPLSPRQRTAAKQVASLSVTSLRSFRDDHSFSPWLYCEYDQED